jgi:SAM-dependent methyltransferase
MIGLPPGTILQLMYLRKRVKPLRKTYSSFLEIGAGNGMISSELLDLGFTGTAVDLNSGAHENNKYINKFYIDAGKYTVINGNFMDMKGMKFDIITSCMVIEHIPDDDLFKFIEKCKEMLNSGGRLIFLVPSSMKYWGIEDEVAGHIKRYELKDIEKLSVLHNLKIADYAGLTYPISNWLFRLSNKIVKKSESDKLSLSQKARTIYTGNRNIMYKTTFPRLFNLVLNPFILAPFYFLQNLNLKNSNAMVLYFELIQPKSE